jgi:hypothetical protein
MDDITIELLKTHFRQLRLPTMGQEFDREITLFQRSDLSAEGPVAVFFT